MRYHGTQTKPDNVGRATPPLNPRGLEFGDYITDDRNSLHGGWRTNVGTSMGDLGEGTGAATDGGFDAIMAAQYEKNSVASLDLDGYGVAARLNGSGVRM